MYHNLLLDHQVLPSAPKGPLAWYWSLHYFGFRANRTGARKCSSGTPLSFVGSLSFCYTDCISAQAGQAAGWEGSISNFMNECEVRATRETDRGKRFRVFLFL